MPAAVPKTVRAARRFLVDRTHLRLGLRNLAEPETPHRKKINEQLNRCRATGVDDDVLPSAGARGNKGLVDLVPRGSRNGFQDTDDPPFSPPQIAQVRAPGAREDCSNAVAIGISKGQEDK